jgi:hypothetical protein
MTDAADRKRHVSVCANAVVNMRVGWPRCGVTLRVSMIKERGAFNGCE